jgi:hypothetical protein
VTINPSALLTVPFGLFLLPDNLNRLVRLMSGKGAWQTAFALRIVSEPNLVSPPAGPASAQLQHTEYRDIDSILFALYLEIRPLLVSYV